MRKRHINSEWAKDVPKGMKSRDYIAKGVNISWFTLKKEAVIVDVAKLFPADFVRVAVGRGARRHFEEVRLSEIVERVDGKEFSVHASYLAIVHHVARKVFEIERLGKQQGNPAQIQAPVDPSVNTKTPRT